MEPTELQRAAPGGAPASDASRPIRTQVRSLFRSARAGRPQTFTDKSTMSRESSSLYQIYQLKGRKHSKLSM